MTDKTVKTSIRMLFEDQPCLGLHYLSFDLFLSHIILQRKSKLLNFRISNTYPPEKCLLTAFECRNR